MLTTIVMKKASPLKFKRDLDISLVIKNVIYLLNVLGETNIHDEQTKKKDKADFFKIKNNYMRAIDLNLYHFRIFKSYNNKIRNIKTLFMFISYDEFHDLFTKFIERLEIPENLLIKKDRLKIIIEYKKI